MVSRLVAEPDSFSGPLFRSQVGNLTTAYSTLIPTVMLEYAILWPLTAMLELIIIELKKLVLSSPMLIVKPPSTTLFIELHTELAI